MDEEQQNGKVVNVKVLSSAVSLYKFEFGAALYVFYGPLDKLESAFSNEGMTRGSKEDKKPDVNAEPDKGEQDLEKVFEHMDEKHGFFINRLRDFVEFRTVAEDPLKKDEFPRMAEYLVQILRKFGIKSTVMNMIETDEDDTRMEGDVVPLILAETEIDPRKRTVLFYTHYDVNPINYHECWVDPFELTMTSDDSELHGKGTSAGKGPLLCIINAIGAYQKLKIPLPVNVKIILDPMGTVEQDFTGKFLKRVDTDFFFNIDSVCLCMGRWLGTARPCVSHGSRGICYFQVEVEGPSKDLHSGSYGGLFNEPMSDLIYVLNSLVDKNGVIRITDIYEDVPPVTKEQKKFFKSVHFIVRNLQQEIGATELQVNEEKAAILMRLWCQPSLTIHGIQGAFSGPGRRNVIPGKVTGKFSINIVPNMTPSKVKKKVVDYLAKVWKTRKTTNKIRVQMTVGKLSWYTDPSDMNVVAAKNAVTKVCYNEPDLVREPKRIKIANVLRKLTEAPVVMIPIGKSNDISDTDSEKIDVINYLNGGKIFAAYMKYLAELFPRVKTPEETQCTCKITGQLESCKCYLQYIPPEEEVDYPTMDWSLSEMSPASGDEQPAFRYYYMSLIAMKRMQKLQEVISVSHLAPVWSSEAPLVHEIEGEEGADTARVASRAALASFSVADLQDESKPRTGLWLPKPVVNQQEAVPMVAVTPLEKAVPESSTRVVPHPAERATQATVALQPTVFSFRLAQKLKRDKSDPFNPANRHVLRDIRSHSVPPKAKILKTGPAKNAIGALASPSRSKVRILSQHIVASSAPDLQVTSPTKSEKMRVSPSASDVFHPNVNRSINPSDVMSSTSRILYDKRLKKKFTESTVSVKSEDLTLATSKSLPKVTTSRSLQKMTSNRKSSQAGPTDSETTTGTASVVLTKPAEYGTPGGPIQPYAVVSSVSRIMFDRRMTKEVTDSMKALMGSGTKVEDSVQQVGSRQGIDQQVGSRRRMDQQVGSRQQTEQQTSASSSPGSPASTKSAPPSATLRPVDLAVKSATFSPEAPDSASTPMGSIRTHSEHGEVQNQATGETNK